MKKDLVKTFEILQWECPNCHEINDVDYFESTRRSPETCLKCGHEVELKRD